MLGGIALAGLLAMSILFFARSDGSVWAIIGISVWAILFLLGCIWIRRHPWRVVPACDRRSHLVRWPACWYGAARLDALIRAIGSQQG